MSKIKKVSICIDGVLVIFEQGYQPRFVTVNNRAQIPETEITEIEVHPREAQVKIWYKDGRMQEYNNFPYVVHTSQTVTLKGAGIQ